VDLSLLNRTAVFVMRPETLFEDHGAYGVLRTPTAPSYYSGNVLLLDEPLAPARLESWVGIFSDTFRDSGVRHIRLEWTGPEPTAAEQATYQAAGYELTTILCMTAQAPTPVERLNPALEIRPLRDEDSGRLKRFLLDTQADWGAAFMDFMVGNILLRHRELEGNWWLGWLDGQVAGSMGLFFDGPLGRFQSVDTHPAFRRRGVARTMVAHLTQHGFARPQTERLVIVADQDYFAVRLYEQCGYRTLHRQYELFKPPPE
jgi:ribosomal protein S18 acetylase RimI-like enzyme